MRSFFDTVATMLLWALGVAFIAAASASFGVAAAQPERSSRSVKPLSVQEIAPGVFVHRGLHEEATTTNLGGIANIGFIIGDSGVGVIDTGGSLLEGKGLLAAIREITNLPVRYVINTHFHPDHVFGNAAFTDQAIEFVGHARLPRALAARQDSYLSHLREALGSAADGSAIVLPQHLIAKHEVIDLGGRQLLLTAYPPAHTDADLTVLDRKTRTLFAGDLVFLQRIPAIDGSALGWVRAISMLRKIAAKRVVPGHGPRVADWPSALAGEECYLKLIVHQTRDILSVGGSIEQAVKQIGTSERSLWLLFDDYNARNVATAYAELEWE